VLESEAELFAAATTCRLVSFSQMMSRNCARRPFCGLFDPSLVGCRIWGVYRRITLSASYGLVWQEFDGLFGKAECEEDRFSFRWPKSVVSMSSSTG